MDKLVWRYGRSYRHEYKQETAPEIETEQPVPGAKIYFFRAILHNWSPQYAVRILRNIISALLTGSKILIQYTVIPEADKVEKQKEAMSRTGSMDMHALFNSDNREMSEWAELFREADSNFHFKGGHYPLWKLSESKALKVTEPDD